jgi:hypothetical protein
MTFKTGRMRMRIILDGVVIVVFWARGIRVSSKHLQMFFLLN